MATFLRLPVLSWSTNQELTMNCKIERVVSDEHLVVVLISGRTRRRTHRPSISEVLCWSNREVVELLAQSEANGSELRNCPPYVREWVAREGD